ncbi:MAG: 30S ribosomal protein S12 methylthiotransferase RimO [Clostridia bacterium]|nr:30S ribosomal protein S12 methylthiotransferase RimO [Clostridia bacterium]MBR6006683.1 30S ribosomal protein S12 methylthiotransferase RimO [Clostridia bacterium]
MENKLKYNRVGAVSLGCSKNTVDTEIMLGELASLGFTVVSDPAEAEIIIVNTCGFITSAKQDSIDTILDMAQYKTAGSCKFLAVTGCLSERYRNELPPELPEVDLFWGVRDYPAFARELYRVIAGEEAPSSDEASSVPHSIVCGDVHRLVSTPPWRAYLRIADGCDNRCTYCAIPLIRGGRVSVPMEKLIDEAKALAASGVTELTVIAQDTSAYGIDLYGRPMLRELLAALSAIEGFVWIRVLYAYPNTITEELVDAMRDDPKIVNYIDIPIQHISKRMLTAMNRHGSAEHIRQICAYIRKNAPDFILRTTVMLGFPGETEEDFNELMAFLAEQPFDRIGAFVYSPEDGTPAAEMPDQVDEAVAEARLDAVMRRQQAISLELNKKRIGSTVRVLVESVMPSPKGNGYTAIGRSYAEAADVDGVIRLRPESGRPFRLPQPGEYVWARITKAYQYDLEAVVPGE